MSRCRFRLNNSVTPDLLFDLCDHLDRLLYTTVSLPNYLTLPKYGSIALNRARPNIVSQWSKQWWLNRRNICQRHRKGATQSINWQNDFSSGSVPVDALFCFECEKSRQKLWYYAIFSMGWVISMLPIHQRILRGPRPNFFESGSCFISRRILTRDIGYRTGPFWGIDVLIRWEL
jgi:hypothetical protein